MNTDTNLRQRWGEHPVSVAWCLIPYLRFKPQKDQWGFEVLIWTFVLLRISLNGNKGQPYIVYCNHGYHAIVTRGQLYAAQIFITIWMYCTSYMYTYARNMFISSHAYSTSSRPMASLFVVRMSIYVHPALAHVGELSQAYWQHARLM